MTKGSSAARGVVRTYYRPNFELFDTVGELFSTVIPETAGPPNDAVIVTPPSSGRLTLKQLFAIVVRDVTIFLPLFFSCRFYTHFTFLGP
jgi:hypothetical protein